MLPEQKDTAVKRFFIAVGLVTFINIGGAAGYYLLTGGSFSFLDCVWMTVNSVFTVGFREVIPVSGSSLLKVYTIVLIFTGAGTILYLISLVTAFIIEGDLNALFRRRRMDKDINRLNGHYVICGAGRSGEHAILQMAASKFPFIVVDRQEKTVWEFLSREGLEAPYIVGDASDESVLIRAGIVRAKGLIAALPEDQDNIFLVLTARQLNPKLRIVSKVNEHSSRRKLFQVGANAVVSPSEMGGRRMFNDMVRPGVVSFVEQMIHDNEQNLIIDEVVVCPGSPLHGRKLSETDIRSKHNLLVVGVLPGEGGEFTYNPGPDFRLSEGMTLMVLGPRESITVLRTSCAI